MLIGELLWKTSTFNWILNQVMTLNKANFQTYCDLCYQKKKKVIKKYVEGNLNIVYYIE